MDRLFSILVLATLFTKISVNAIFSDNPKPCKYEDSVCITEVINYIIHEKSEGESSLNLVKIDPLDVSKISIKQGEESPINIDLMFTNNLIYGFKDAVVSKVKGFTKDLTQKHEIHMKLKVVHMIGDYSINGKVLILPISGEGKSNITFVNPDLIIFFSGKSKKHNGETYMSVNNLRIDVMPYKILYNFENLFNNQKELSDNMNSFLNENWRDIFNEVKVSLLSAFAQIFQSVINNVFQKYPYEKYFIME